MWLPFRASPKAAWVVSLWFPFQAIHETAPSAAINAPSPSSLVSVGLLGSTSARRLTFGAVGSFKLSKTNTAHGRMGRSIEQEVASSCCRARVQPQSCTLSPPRGIKTMTLAACPNMSTCGSLKKKPSMQKELLRHKQHQKASHAFKFPFLSGPTCSGPFRPVSTTPKENHNSTTVFRLSHSYCSRCRC